MHLQELANSGTTDGHQQYNGYDLDMLPFSAISISRIRRAMLRFLVTDFAHHLPRDQYAKPLDSIDDLC